MIYFLVIPPKTPRVEKISKQTYFVLPEWEENYDVKGITVVLI